MRSCRRQARFVVDLDKTDRSATLPHMPRDGTATRERILDVATDIAIDRGFAAASLDEVLGQSGVTKGAFYHYFGSKADLGRAILDRYADGRPRDARSPVDPGRAAVARPAAAAAACSSGCSRTSTSSPPTTPAACTRPSSTSASWASTGPIDVIEASVRAWRGRFRAKLDEVVERYPPRIDVDLDALSDLVFSTSEGAYIVARATRDPALVRGQLLQVRAYLELLFAPATRPPPPTGRGSGPPTPAPRVDPRGVHGRPDEPGFAPAARRPSRARGPSARCCPGSAPRTPPGSARPAPGSGPSPARPRRARPRGAARPSGRSPGPRPRRACASRSAPRRRCRRSCSSTRRRSGAGARRR